MLQKSVAIVTGAGSGIGRAVCLQLAHKGYALALVGRNTMKLEGTSRQIQQEVQGADLLLISADVGADHGPAQIIDQTLARHQRVDVLVNNAAINQPAPIAQFSRESFRSVFETNTFGPAMLIALLWPVFSRQRAGCIVNISSMSAADPFPGLGVYGASKAALECLARAVRNEGAEQGIRAYNIAPGAVETDMLRALFSKEQLPESRALSPARVAQVAIQCILGERAEASGSTLILPSP